MKRILNESGHERNRNAGDEAYFATMVDMFRKYLGEVQINAFSDRPERDRSRYNVETIYSGGSLIKTFSSFFKIIRAIMNCDVYVWGSGQILRDDTGIKSPLYRLSRPFLAKILRKKVMAYAPGIGPLETRTGRFLARRVLNTFDLITVRETFSKELLEGLGVSKPNILVTVDPAFGLNVAASQDVARMLKEIGIDETEATLVGIAPFGPAFRGVRSLLPAKYQVKFDMWKQGGKDKYYKHIEIMAETCDYVIEKYKAKLIFIAQDASWQGLDDRITNDIISMIRDQDSVVSLNADDYSPGLLKGIMGKMEVLIGGRLHSLILACGICTPVIGICFEQKIKNFASVIGQEQYFIDVKEIVETGSLVSIIDRLWIDREKVREELDIKMKELRQMVKSNVLLLDEMLSK
jgi:polysaccharide pyruvyl transferase CsaB